MAVDQQTGPLPLTHTPSQTTEIGGKYDGHEFLTWCTNSSDLTQSSILAIVGDRIYLRSDDELGCFELTAP